jgi:WD40 repeat protein
MVSVAAEAEALSRVASSPPKIESSKLCGHKRPVLCLALSSTKGQLLSGSEDGTIRVWDLRTQRCDKAIVWNQGEVTSVAFHPTKTNVIFASAGNAIASFDLSVPGVILRKPIAANKAATKDEINAILLDPRGYSLVTADDAGELRVFNASTLKVVEDKHRKMVLGTHENIVSCLSLQPGANQEFKFASGALDATVKIWSARKRKRLQRLQIQAAAAEEDGAGTSGAQMLNPPLVHSLTYSRDGGRLACGCGDGGIVIYNGHTHGYKSRIFGGHTAAVAQVVYTDAGQLISGGNDRQVCVWSDDGQVILRFLHAEPINFFSACNSALYVAGCGNDIIVYQGACLS